MLLRRRTKARKLQAEAAAHRRAAESAEARSKVAERVDDLTDALEAAREAIARASTEAARKSAEASREAARKSAEASRAARRRGARAARKAVENRLPEPEQVADATRRATDKLFPERAEQRRRAERKRRRGVFYKGAGLAGLGVLAGWLTAPRRGSEARQVVKEQATKATETARQRVGEAKTTGPGYAGPAGAGPGDEPAAAAQAVRDASAGQPAGDVSPDAKPTSTS